MTVTLHIKPELEHGLLAKAQASGMALQEFLLSVVEDAAAPVKSETSEQSAGEEAVRRMLEFGEKHKLSLGEPITRQLLREGRRY